MEVNGIIEVPTYTLLDILFYFITNKKLRKILFSFILIIKLTKPVYLYTR